MMKIKHSVNVLPCMALNLIRTAEVAPAEMRDTTRVTMRLETFFMIAIEVGSSSISKEKPANDSWQVRSCVQCHV